jgi:copper homeostasis protein
VKIPVMVMVRPHSYSFVYRKDEWDAIREDIKMIQELGAAGIVFGALNEKQAVDVDILAMVLKEAKGLSVTFHRAIDQADSQEVYKSLCHSPYHVDRILTSGGKATVLEGLEPLKGMVAESRKSSNQPIIMPGSGLTSSNIESVHEQLQASEYHFGSAVRIGGEFRNRINEDEIQRIKRIVN